MTDINFDQFKQEIRVAENYLRAATSHNSIPDSTSSKKVRASADGLIVLDASKKESILQQFGRRPLAASQETASRISWKRDAVADEMIYERSTFDGGSVQSDPYWKEGGRSSLGYSTDKASSKEDAFGRYSARSEREKLINRLLVDHNSKKSEGTSGGNGNDTPSTYLDVSPGSREYENTDRYSKPSSIEVPTAASPDSLDTSSDDDNTLFFASDLNTSVNAEIRLDPPVSRPASGPSHDRHYPLESPDVINKNYLGEYDAFSRLTGGEVGRGSYRLDSSERNININIGGSGSSGSGSGDRSSSWTRGDGEDGRDIQGSRGLSTIAGSSSNSTRLQDSSDESTAINLSPGETTTPGPVAASAAVADTSTRHRYNDSTDDCNFESDVKSGAPRKEAAKGVVKKRFNKSKEQLQKEAEESFQRQYANKSISSPGDDKKNRSAMDRIEFMQKWYTKSRDDREKQRKEFLQIELMNCTFRPQITKMGDSTTRTRTKSSSGVTQFNAVEYLSGGTGYSAKEQQEGKQRSAVDETSIRLHDDAEQRSTQQRWLEKQVVEARLAQFTFQPSINPATVSYFDSMDYKPIYERVGELQKEREDRMRTLKQSHEDAQVDLTFTPQIDTNSRQIADRRFDVADREDGRSKATHAHSLLQQTDVSSRLHREAHLAAMRRQQLCSERDELQSAEMEPARLSKGTEKLAQFSAKVGASFSERQAIHLARVQQNSTALQRAAEEEGAAWFKPEIGRSSSIVASKRPEQLKETAESRAQRMSQDESAGMERRRKEKEQELYGGMTFAPDIDPLSRAMGRTRGLQELVDNTIGQKVRAVSKMIADRIEESKCTFKPCINSYPIYNQNSSFASDERNDVSRYNADLTPTCWTAGTERRIHGSEITSGSVEVDEDSLDPISQYWQPAGNAEGLRSRQFDGKHQDQYRSCTINLEEPERMARNIKQQLAEKEERRRAELIAREIEEMKECTFRPTISTYPPGGHNSSYSQSSHSSAPVVVRGLSRHLELRHLSIKQREDAERREKEVFSVKNIDQFRRVQDGSTIVKPFLFSDMSNRSCSQTTIGHEFNPNLTNTSTAGTVSYNNRSRLGIMQR